MFTAISTTTIKLPRHREPPPGFKLSADAARYCGSTPGSFKVFRCVGKGPDWYKRGSDGAIFYSVGDLDEWLRAKSDAAVLAEIKALRERADKLASKLHYIDPEHVEAKS